MNLAMGKKVFELWLEFEHWEGQENDDPDNDFFNMQIHLSNGKSYALNVWTFKYLETARNQDRITGESCSGKYLIPPDLFVEKMERELLEEVVAELISTNAIKDDWLIDRDESANSID